MFQIDFSSRTPIYRQLINSFLQLTAADALKPGDKLPPVRTLALELGVNPNTVAKAYQILEQEGYIYSNVGRGSFVSDRAGIQSAQKHAALEEFKKAAEKAASVGATKEELVQAVNSVF